jgi:hypothetical protein
MELSLIADLIETAKAADPHPAIGGSKTYAGAGFLAGSIPEAQHLSEAGPCPQFGPQPKRSSLHLP